MEKTLLPNAPIKLYRSVISGHSHRAELFLSLLDLPYTPIDIDLLAGQQKQPEFLRLNPFGQVPVIDDNGVIVADSNAILVYLATKYGEEHWLPRDPIGAARVQSWLSVAAGEIAFGPAAARLGRCFGMPIDIETAAQRAKNLFNVMEILLEEHPLLVGENVTIADIACYSYIARAPEGGISLDHYPRISAWLAHIETLPRFVPMIELAGS
ncbi:MAG TPA: glutathione S-transferase [Paraburkholderia sp.]|uniref:glutathione S-transferase family protein n=1 Tax=Paraburkholderia sp. TaxID=1926495 RepID=UPI002B48F328|nr:glutathione S-transferase [Paraburkholderia sp.]HKR45652.1 glutathione S-transferase [Paraburkholderia sp.]